MLGGNLLQAWKWAFDLVFYGAHLSTLSTSPLNNVQLPWWIRLKRLGLVLYWAGTIVLAVGGWQTRLVRARRIRIGGSKSATGNYGNNRSVSSRSNGPPLVSEKKNLYASTVVGLKTIAGNVGNVASGVGVGNLSGPSEGNGRNNEVLNKVGAEDAREEKRVHASLNMRRKFFHALAVTMFVPGIAIDVCLSSVSIWHCDLP